MIPQLIAGGLQLAGAATSIAGQVMEGEATRASLKFNIRSIKAQRDQALEDLEEEASQQSAANRVAIAKSGVTLTGSPLEVLVDNAAKVSQERQRINRAAAAQIAPLKAARSNVRTQVGLSAAGTALGTFGNIAGTFAR